MLACWNIQPKKECRCIGKWGPVGVEMNENQKNEHPHEMIPHKKI